ncbi:MAG: SDR family oxidoreductase [Myxococcota bacterium]|jgi:NAD(P)-dependent dehydrogenase (short-subunit alcohol dehydrogenase family)|nr:SDR family oxidoreductase [Myxococcota bacterium]
MVKDPVDLSGKHVMITGCTAGLGRAAALELASMGARVSIVCRDERKGEELARDIERKTGRDDTRVYVGDMGVQADVRDVGERFLETGEALDVLFNNAGVVNQQRAVTTDGFEATFAVNHLAYYVLSVMLAERLQEAPEGRVVCTASDAYKFVNGSIDFDDLQSERRYTTFGAYGSSKLANILFTRELARRLQGTNVTANAFHPGMVGSDFAKNNGFVAQVAMTLIKPLARSPLKGAETGIYLCSSPDVAGHSGGYYYDCKQHTTRAAARDDADARRLWEVSEKLTGVSLP